MILECLQCFNPTHTEILLTMAKNFLKFVNCVFQPTIQPNVRMLCHIKQNVDFIGFVIRTAAF